MAVLSRDLGGVYVAAWRAGEAEPATLWAEAGQPQTRPSDEELAAAAFGQLTPVSADGVKQQGRLLGSELVPGASLVLQIMSGGSDVPRSLWVELVDVLAELHRRTLLSQTLGRSGRFTRVMELVTALHDDLDQSRILNVFATDAVPVLAAQRIFIARRRGRRWAIAAATGVTAVNPRADDVRHAVERVREAARNSHTPLEADSNAADADTNQHSDEQHDVVLPIAIDRSWRRARHAVLVESDTALDKPTVELLTHHLEQALRNARQADQATLFGRLKRLPSTIFRPTSLTMLALLGACVAWLWFGTAELKIDVYGEALPEIRKSIFAPEDGVLSDFRFGSESSVNRDDVLCVLDNDGLELERERLSGELATSLAKLTALNTLRGTGDRLQAASVSAEREELRLRIESLREQLALVQQQLASLEVAIPLTGQVAIEGRPEEWIGRPVRRGQYLAEVSDVTGPWEIRLRIPERDIRHVLAATGATSPPPVTFVLETDTETRVETTLGTIEASTDVDAYGELSTIAVAAFPEEALNADARPGAGVIASIRCGPHRAGFVYLRRLIETIQRHVWF